MQRSINPIFDFEAIPLEIWALIIRITILINFNSIRALSLTSKTLNSLVDSESKILLKELFEAVNESVNKKLILHPNRCVFFRAASLEAKRLTPLPEQKTAGVTSFQRLYGLRQELQESVHASDHLHTALADIQVHATSLSLPENLRKPLSELVDTRNYEGLEHICFTIAQSFAEQIPFENVIDVIYYHAIKHYNDIEFLQLLFYIPVDINRRFRLDLKSMLDKAFDAGNTTVIQFLLNSGITITSSSQLKSIPEYLVTHIANLVKEKNYWALKEIYDVLTTVYSNQIDANYLIDAIYSRVAEIYDENEFTQLFALLPIDINKQVRYLHKYFTIDLYTEYLYAPLLHLAIFYNNPSLVNYLIEKGADVHQCAENGGSVAMLVDSKIAFKRAILEGAGLSLWSRRKLDNKVNDIQATLNCLEKFFPVITKDQFCYTLHNNIQTPFPEDVYKPSCTIA